MVFPYVPPSSPSHSISGTYSNKNFSGQDLRNTRFGFTIIENTNFSGADLNGSDLEGTLFRKGIIYYFTQES